MRNRNLGPRTAVGLFALVGLALASGGSLAQEEIEVPQPGVPQLFTLEGQFVRIAYNNEGYVTLGYRMANQSVGEEWMLLEIGATVRRSVKNQVLKRGAFSLDTPDHTGIPLATQGEYEGANLRALDMRAARVVRDSINYFPPDAARACRIGFFTDISRTRAVAHDDVELSSTRGCLGRVYFQVPGGIRYGQHWLNVKFEQSLVRVPFRILTDEETKKLSKTWKDIKEQHEKAFKK
jgi:hypothetical protein